MKRVARYTCWSNVARLQGWLAEAWLVKEAAAILLASWIPDGRSPLKSVNLHTWLHALSHKSTTCVIRIQSIQTWMADERAIAALLLSPPSVIALRPIDLRIETECNGA